MPLPIHLSHLLVNNHATLRASKKLPFVRPDAKSQVTVEYGEDGSPVRIHTVVLSTQHDESVVQVKKGVKYFSDDARKVVLDKLIEPTLKSERPDLLKGKLVLVTGDKPNKGVGENDIRVFINPTGCFLEGGPHGDCG